MRNRPGIAMLAAVALGLAGAASSAVVPHRDAIPARRERMAQPRRRKKPGLRDPKGERKKILDQHYASRIETMKKVGKVDRLGNLANMVRREKKVIRRELGLKTGRAWRRWKKAAERADRAKVAS